jgi:hypothetical protein
MQRPRSTGGCAARAPREHDGVQCFAMRRVPPLLVAAGLSLVACVPARVDVAPTALDELKQGEALKHAGKCREASLWFTHSFYLDPKPQALLYLAECEARLGDFVAAKRDATHGSDLAFAVQDKELATAARAMLVEIEKHLAHLTVTLAQGAPPDCTISLDRLPIAPSTFGVVMAVTRDCRRRQGKSRAAIRGVPLAGRERRG